jgi:hypothetical protein
MVMTRRWHGFGLVVALLVLGALAGNAAQGSARAASPPTEQIAAATFDHDLMVSLTATRGSGGGGAPPATVRFVAYQLTARGWTRIGSHIVGEENGWFWKVLTRGGAVCRFSSGDRPPIKIKIRLLVSPSIGCSQAYTYFVGLPAPT